MFTVEEMKMEVINMSDGSRATLAQHMEWTPDEEWQEDGFSDIAQYFDYLFVTGKISFTGGAE